MKADVSVPRGGFLWPSVAAAIAFVLLGGLGTWQVQRLGEKQRLLAEIAARLQAAPAVLPPEESWSGLAPDAYEYRRVVVSGIFDSAKQALVFRPQANGRAKNDGPGYLLLTPLRLASGATVIVDRGFVPLAQLDRAGRVEGPVTISGLMRQPESRNPFTPSDEPAQNHWFTRDPRAIAAHFHIGRAAPFTIDADDTAPAGQWPVGGQTLIDIPNNHLSYAVTWYGLAATLVGVWGAFIWGRKNSKKGFQRPSAFGGSRAEPWP